ncbi:retrotransposon protein [Cucumis melo var. makuwa]|uniref:Retrotransposon protein n=1 Tax=Cucumis melo var. makuwa TaxID=1194695 RepID=A0A5D3CSY3_CUCMM|nr:retrotransposon protein [Cucumis melo var. makuwa]
MNVDDLEDIDMGDSVYARTVGDDIHYIETSNEWTQWRDELVIDMFNKWQLPKGLLNKLCPYYDELAYVFRRDRATGRGAETFADVKSNDPNGYEGFQLHDRNDIEIPTMYNQGFNMSKRIYGPHDLVEHPMCANDQLRAIVEWPSVALQNETTVRQEVLCQLHAIPELSRLDMVHCSRILFCNLDDMRGFLEILEDEKMDFCTVLLRELLNVLLLPPPDFMFF